MNKLKFLILLLLTVPVAVFAAKKPQTKTVSATATYVLSDNDNITLRQARARSIDQAKVEAVKAEFGERITSDIYTSNTAIDGEEQSSYWDIISASAKGEWIEDIEPPAVTMEVVDNTIVFTATVKGKAREIIQSNIDLRWEILHDINNRRVETDQIFNKEQIFVKFKSPIDGYLAIYYLESDSDEAFCLLPYPKDPSGIFRVESGKEYEFFDPNIDRNATPYRFTTDDIEQRDQIFIIFSPNRFTKFNGDSSNTSKNPGSLSKVSTLEFRKWNTKIQNNDPDMVVDKKWITIKK